MCLCTLQLADNIVVQFLYTDTFYCYKMSTVTELYKNKR
jgi:hypothetical protein